MRSHSTAARARRGLQRFLQTRKNDLLELPPSIALTTDLRAAQEAEVIIISIGSQGLRALLGELRPLGLRGQDVRSVHEGTRDRNGSAA